jgi:phosphatidylglycerol:prolipoprotein diacylglycerol transferase
MFTFLHTFNPQPILISLGPFHIYWYGLIVVTGIIAAILVAVRLGRFYDFSSDLIFDLSFWLIVGGLLGARLYDVLLELPYYIEQPLAVFKVWRGGLAIHGAILGGLLSLYLFSKKYKHNFWLLSSLVVPGLTLALSIGRWGNYFNQEIFGLPTSLPWGIPIDITHRPDAYMNFEYFHPTFLYESIGSFIIFVVLLLMHRYFIRSKATSYQLSTISFLMTYSLLRFSLEFIRLDRTPVVLGLRWPQWISFLIILISIGWLIYARIRPPLDKSKVT